MNMVTTQSALAIQSIKSMPTELIEKDFLLSQAIDTAKAAYGDDVFMVLLSTKDE